MRYISQRVMKFGNKYYYISPKISRAKDRPWWGGSLEEKSKMNWFFSCASDMGTVLLCNTMEHQLVKKTALSSIAGFIISMWSRGAVHPTISAWWANCWAGCMAPRGYNESNYYILLLSAMVCQSSLSNVFFTPLNH